ncbi:hypothetical protein STEG23_009667, partial [Scotinomys teguina]
EVEFNSFPAMQQSQKEIFFDIVVLLNIQVRRAAGSNWMSLPDSPLFVISPSFRYIFKLQAQTRMHLFPARPDYYVHLISFHLRLVNMIAKIKVLEKCVKTNHGKFRPEREEFKAQPLKRLTDKSAMAFKKEKLQALEELVQEQLNAQHIEESTNPGNSPVFVIEKKSRNHDCAKQCPKDDEAPQ